MTSDPSLMLLLGDDDELSSVLGDANVKHVVIMPTGRWKYDKLGRSRGGEMPVSNDTIDRLSDAVQASQATRLGDWVFRRFKGVDGWSYLIERVPTPAADRLPPDIVSMLKRQIRRDGNGVIAGEPGSSKSGLLLWLAMQVPDEPVLLISENPPEDMPGENIVHVFPPNSTAERRNLERLARLHGTVMWDRVASPNDLHALFGFCGARRRWFSLDASSAASTVRTLLGYMNQGVDARVETLLALTKSVIGRPEVMNLLVVENGEWTEPYKSDASALELMRSFGHHQVAGLNLTTRSNFSGVFQAAPADTPPPAIASSPEPAPQPDKPAPVQAEPVAPAEPPRPEPAPPAPEPAPAPTPAVEAAPAAESTPDFVIENPGLGEESSMAAGILKRPKKRRQRQVEPEFDHPIDPATIPLSEASEYSEVSEAIAPDESPDERTGLLTPQDLDDLTGRRAAMNVPEMLDDERTGMISADDLTSLTGQHAAVRPPDDQRTGMISADDLTSLTGQQAAVRPQDDERTGMISADDLTSLTGQHAAVHNPDDERTGMLNAEDVESLTGRRAAVPETTRHYDTDTPTSTADGDLIRDILPGSVPGPVNLADLRITTAEDVDQESLRALSHDDDHYPDVRTARANLESVNFDIDDVVGDALSEISDMDDDISGVLSNAALDIPATGAIDPFTEDDVATSVANSRDVGSVVQGFGQSNGWSEDVTLTDSPQFRRDPDTSPTSNVSSELVAAVSRHRDDADEATRELSIDDKIRQIKRRLDDDN